MNNGLPGPSTTDTITGGKTLELTEYDRHRKPHTVINDGTMVNIGARTLSSEICCPICLDLFTTTMGTKECLHRFCSECINTALLRNNKECPTCRKKIVSKRSLRCDSNLDGLLSKIWPERRMYDEMQNEAMKNYHQQNCVASLQKSIEAGIKAQAQNRRQRVQGSYDYEKRKRKRKVPEGEQNDTTAPNSPSDATPPIMGEDGESVADTNSVNQNDADGSSSFDSFTSELSSDISSTITDSSDAESLSSEDENSPSSVDHHNHQNSAPPSLENMLAVGSPAEDDLSELPERMSQSASLKKYQELEIELIPSHVLKGRSEIANPLKKNRFIKTHRNATVEHISEYLLQASRLELLDMQGSGQEVQGIIPTPTHFFGYDADSKLYSVPLTETLRHLHTNAPSAADHLKLFFDVDERPEERWEEDVIGGPQQTSADLDDERIVVE
ncbi:RING-type domain-containing protein [Aphelenchoides fujianensis]|nr:RING-type domain-containing protein [Aphelenchoides fujianensis]